jgi:hypothetical protein
VCGEITGLGPSVAVNLGTRASSHQVEEAGRCAQAAGVARDTDQSLALRAWRMFAQGVDPEVGPRCKIPRP